VASLEAWTKHLIRNESVIVDLFHGQYKSTLICSVCNKVSITFDPFMTLSLPISGKKKKLSFFFIPYEMKDGYVNHSGHIFLRETESIYELRMEIAKKYKVDPGSFIATRVHDNVFKKLLDQNSKVEDLVTTEGVTLLYEINPELHPQLVPKEKSNKMDSNYGIPEEQWTKAVVNMLQPQKNQYSYYIQVKPFIIPRIMWINKNWTLMEVHHEVFKFFRYSL